MYPLVGMLSFLVVTVATTTCALGETNITYITSVTPRDADHKPIIGQDVQLVCTVDRVGHPLSTNFSWYKDDQIINAGLHYDGVNTSVLTIVKLIMADDGIYSCLITNSAGRGEVGSNFTLTVIDINIIYITNVTLRDADHKPIIGLDLQLMCVVDQVGYPSSMDYFWYKNDQIIKPSKHYNGVKTSVLTILQLVVLDNAIYSCRINNSAGCGEVGSNLTLTVGTMPTVSLNGPNRPLIPNDKNVTLNCSVQAIPPASIKWLKNNSPIPEFENNPKYIIPNPDHTDQGMYRCSATNIIGVQVAELQLEVYYGPFGLPRVLPNRTAILVDKPTKFTCSISHMTQEERGNPTGKWFTWSNRDVKVPSEEGAGLTLHPKLVTDIINLTCKLENYYGGTPASIPVVPVIEAPPSFESKPCPESTHPECIYSPLRNSTLFNFTYIVTSTQPFAISLFNNSSEDILSKGDFVFEEKVIHGDFTYGHTQAKQFTFKWNDNKDLSHLSTCGRLQYFNGAFTLTAIGSLGEIVYVDSEKFTIAAEFAPAWMGPSILHQEMGKPTHISCTVCASPAPSSYHWTFNSGGLPDEVSVIEGGRTLYIEELQASHYGYYGCTVINSPAGGAEGKLYKLNLQPPPASGLSKGAIAGIVIGCIAGIALILVAVAVIFRLQRRQPTYADNNTPPRHPPPPTPNWIQKGAHLPNAYEVPITLPPPPPGAQNDGSIPACSPDDVYDEIAEALPSRHNGNQDRNQAGIDLAYLTARGNSEMAQQNLYDDVKQL